MWDSQDEEHAIIAPGTPVALAVAASSAFPPLFPPIEISNEMLSCDVKEFPHPQYITDGGVYDNLGLETAWKRYKTVLVSDGGGKMSAEEKPKGDWARHAIRVNSVIDNQVRSLRKRQLISSYGTLRSGAYWGIRSNIRDYGLPDSLPCAFEKTTVLANTKTRLKELDRATQERLINWGYAICDTAMRKWVDATLQKPNTFPYSDSGIG